MSIRGLRLVVTTTITDKAMSNNARQDRQGQRDARLYVPSPEGWTARIKQGWEKEYCYLQRPGEDHFHLILNGEIYLEHGNERYCLSCALRHGLITTERLHWQHGTKKSASQSP